LADFERNMGNIKIIRGVFEAKMELEWASVVAGFPSPADDYMHETLDFNRDYIKHPEASFYGEVEGDSMKDAGIFDGDRVIIDRAVEPHDGSIVLAWIDDPDNFKVWGTVIHLIRTFETV
jgi:DNA polymerase V